MKSPENLSNGTAVVAATGVLFDLWVAFFMADRPDTKITRIITGTFVIFLLYGLFLMWQGWQAEKAG